MRPCAPTPRPATTPERQSSFMVDTRASRRHVNGILLLDKPLGLSSNKALQIAKAIYRAKKAGHTGSLDPLASGMLPICFGEATKVSAFLLDADKEYVTEAALGVVTESGDREGDVVSQRPVPPLDRAEVLRTLTQFTGDIQQIPPMHSALKKDGKPLYRLARKGVEVTREPRQVRIMDLQLLEQTPTTLRLRVRCSKGTYIRTLVEDIGESLGCGAHVSYLARTAVTPFAEHSTITLDALQAVKDNTPEQLLSLLLPIDVALTGFTRVDLHAAQGEAFCAGRLVDLASYPNLPSGPMVRVYAHSGQFLGLGQITAVQALQPKKVFNL